MTPSRAILALLLLLAPLACQETSHDPVKTSPLDKSKQNDKKPTSTEPPLSILFIGNSFTFQGNLPDIVAHLAESSGRARPFVEYAVAPGESLGGHYEKLETHDIIEMRRWDVVVMQESSGMTNSRIGSPEYFAHAATLLCDAVHERSPQARIVLFETWARHPAHEIYRRTFDDPAQMQAHVRLHTFDAAERYIPANAELPLPHPIEVAPVGDTWEHYLMRPDATTLHGDDLYHAGLAGKYLSALVLFSFIYDTTPLELPIPKKVPEATGLALQRAAADLFEAHHPEHDPAAAP